jgi:hypothetical protein
MLVAMARFKSGDLLILQRDLTMAIRRQEETVRELDERIEDAPKRLKRIEAGCYEGSAIIIDAFKKAAKIPKITGYRDLAGLFREKKIKSKRDREELRRRINAVRYMDCTSLIRKGMRPEEIDVEPRIADLVIFAAANRALSHPIGRDILKRGIDLIADSDLARAKTEKELRLDRLMRETAGMILSDLKKGFDMLPHAIQSVRRREALKVMEAEAIGVRRARADAAAAWAPAIEERRKELAEQARKLEDERWAERESRELLRQFFACHSGLVKPMVSILKNIRILCGEALKYEISDISMFEIDVAERECASMIGSLDSADPLRCAAEEERRMAFEALRSEKAIETYNSVIRSMQSQRNIESAINAGRRELAKLELGAAEDMQRRAKETSDGALALLRDLKKARGESSVRLEELRRYYLTLRKKYGLRGGLAGFPEGHQAFIENLIDEDRLRGRTARRLLDVYEEKMRTNPKNVREIWQDIMALRSARS